MLRVFNTLNGRCEARPIRGVSSPVERLVTVCLRIEANRRAKTMTISLLFLDLFYCYSLVVWSPLPVSAPMHVGERPTWLNSEALSRDKDLFFEKKKISLFRPTYTTYTPLCVHLIVRAFVLWGEIFIFEKKSILEKKTF